MSRAVDVLAVMDAFRCGGYQQVCCGFPQGGGMNENGDGEPPECCGQFFDNDDLMDAKAAIVELVEAVSTYRYTTGRLMLDYPIGEPLPGSELDLRRKQREQMFEALAKFGGAA